LVGDAVGAERLDAESLAQARGSDRGHFKGARVVQTPHPPLLEEPPAHRGAELARDVKAPLAPIEARPAERACPAPDTVVDERDTRAMKERDPALGQHSAVIVELDGAALDPALRAVQYLVIFS
jgi:hypothetical protein